jgi:hypothetical protein
VLLQGRHLRALRVLDLRTGQDYELATSHAVMALGHSARDTFAMLHARGVAMEAKPFSIGFRIEHPQSVIDRARWGQDAGHPLLGAADYKLVHHAGNGRTVYSFCMCPGGTVVAATSEPGRVVTNGMSQYSRAERNANAGMVVGVEPADYPRARRVRGPAGRHPWRGGAARGPDAPSPASCCSASSNRAPSSWAAATTTPRRSAWRLPGAPRIHGAGHRAAVLPARRDPGQHGRGPARLRHRRHARGPARLRPQDPRLRHGRRRAHRRGDAHLVPAAHRPRRRLPEPEHPGLYPAGEGAGYAGGILSAGVDGIKVGEAVACALLGLPLPSSGARGSGGAA